MREGTTQACASTEHELKFRKPLTRIMRIPIQLHTNASQRRNKILRRVLSAKVLPWSIHSRCLMRVKQKSSGTHAAHILNTE